MAIDVTTGERRYLTSGDASYMGPKASPDGKYVACVRGTFGSPDEAMDCTLWLVDLATGQDAGVAPLVQSFLAGFRKTEVDSGRPILIDAVIAVRGQQFLGAHQAQCVVKIGRHGILSAFAAV